MLTPSPFQRAILDIIQANDGELTWYQLDRALTRRGGEWDPGIMSRELMPALRELEQGGFLATRAGPHPAQPRYSITPAGQHAAVNAMGTTGDSSEDAGERTVSSQAKVSGVL